MIRHKAYERFCTKPTECAFFPFLRVCLHTHFLQICKSLVPKKAKMRRNADTQHIHENLGHAITTLHSLRAWLAMSANVSVGYNPQTTDIFVCRRHVGNVVQTRRRHSVMSANFSAVGVMPMRPVADTHSDMYVGISKVQ